MYQKCFLSHLIITQLYSSAHYTHRFEWQDRYYSYLISNFQVHWKNIYLWVCFANHYEGVLKFKKDQNLHIATGILYWNISWLCLRFSGHCRYGEDLAQELLSALKLVLSTCGSCRMTFSRRTPTQVHLSSNNGYEVIALSLNIVLQEESRTIGLGNKGSHFF